MVDSLAIDENLGRSNDRGHLLESLAQSWARTMRDAGLLAASGELVESVKDWRLTANEAGKIVARGAWLHEQGEPSEPVEWPEQFRCPWCTELVTVTEPEYDRIRCEWCTQWVRKPGIRDRTEPVISPDVAEFVARWIGEHNGWGDEGAILNEITWRREFLPASITPAQAEHWDYWYGKEALKRITGSPDNGR